MPRSDGLYDLRQIVEEFRRHGDEYGAENRAKNTPQAPDNNHGQVLDAQDEREMVRCYHLQKCHPQCPGYTGIKRAYGKGTELVSEQIDPDNFG